MSKIKVANGMFGKNIYAGSLSKDGKRWLTNKTDVTMEAMTASAIHILDNHEGGVIISLSDGTPEFEIIVKDLREKTDDS